MVALSSVLMLPDFTMPALGDLALLAVAGVFSGLANIMMIKAVIVLKSNVIAPLFYTQLIWGGLLGYVAWGQALPNSALFMLGTAMVIMGGLLTGREKEDTEQEQQVILRMDTSSAPSISPPSGGLRPVVSLQRMPERKLP